jgi:hypothetical protein
MKNMQDTGIDNVFFLEKSCRKIYTIFSAVRQQRKSDVMTSFGLTPPTAPTIITQVPHFKDVFLIPNFHGQVQRCFTNKRRLGPG